MLELFTTVQQTPTDHKGGYELATDAVGISRSRPASNPNKVLTAAASLGVIRAMSGA